jgi:hypothetical protein
MVARETASCPFVLLIAAASFLSLIFQAHAQDERFAGAWRVTSAAPAPWVAADVSPSQESQRFLGEQIIFLPGRVDAPSPWGCTGASYQTTTVPALGLFQGSLDPNSAEADAAAVGLNGETTTLQVSCDTGAFDYHLGAAGLFTALDNVIYTLERAPE